MFYPLVVLESKVPGGNTRNKLFFMQEDCQPQASLCCTEKVFPEYQTKTIK